jgi:hypothetical protein
MIHKLIEKQGEHYITPLFWECHCEDDYIHPASDLCCYACGVEQGKDAHEARVDEVLRYCYRFRLPRDLVNVVVAAVDLFAPELADQIAIPF